MKKVFILVFVIFSGSILHAGEPSLFEIKNNFARIVLTDSLQKKDVWTKNYGKKSPAVAAFMSGFFPGIGQFYNGQYLKGSLFIGGEFLLLQATASAANNVVKPSNKYFFSGTESVGFFVGVWFAVRIWGVVDAFTSAMDINEQAYREQNKTVSLLYFPKDGVQNVGLAIHF
jgi:TM2 domain-containing membrane protein YozV